mgnify:FL=1
MKKLLVFIVFCVFLNNCGGGYYQDPAKYDYQLTELMKKNALRGLDYHAVVHASSSYERPFVYSSSSFESAKKNGLNYCAKSYRDCYVYKLRYLGHDPYTGFIYNENDIKKTKPKKQAKLKTKQKEKKQEQSAPKKEETIEDMLKEVFGDRAMNQIEGLWVTRRDSEEENRIYLIVQSEDFLFEELVISHPVREFEGQISTKIIKKIDKRSYKTKATWLNDGEVDERDGTIKIIDKFKLKYETSKHCYSSEKDCLKAGSFYKKKIWPSKTYSDDANLSKEETKILKEFLD